MQALLKKIQTLGTPLVVLMAVAATASLIAVSEYAFTQAHQARTLLQKHLAVRLSLNALYRLVLDAETGQRGYLLTGNESYLTPYTQAVAQLNDTLNTLRDAVDNNNEMTISEISPIVRMTNKRVAEMEITIALRQRAKIGEEEWFKLVQNDAGKVYMDTLRKDLGVLFKRTNERVDLQLERVQRAQQVGRIGVVLGAVTALATFILFLRQIERTRLVEQDRANELEIEKATLDNTVAERTQELAQLATRLQAVEEKEKEDLARELHDELGSLLTAAKLDLARLKTKLTKPIPPEISERIDGLGESLNNGIALKRRIIEDLRPSALNNLGLLPTLETMLADYSTRTGVPIITDLNVVSLCSESNLALFRVVQESLTNITKYAKAKEVTVTLRQRGHYAELVVSDDGIGFDVGSAPIAAHGLAGMRHRMLALHGSLTIRSSPNMGTTIKAQLPLESSASVLNA